MEITTYVLAVKNDEGVMQLAEERKNSSDLPVGFEPKYADFLFEFAESRIKCKKGQDIFLLKGTLDTATINQQEDFVSAFKSLIRGHNDFSGWEVIDSKPAMSVTDDSYRDRLMHHLRARHSSLFSQKRKNHNINSNVA